MYQGMRFLILCHRCSINTVQLYIALNFVADSCMYQCMVLDLRQQYLSRNQKSFCQCSDYPGHGALIRKRFLAPVILICGMIPCDCVSLVYITASFR